MAQFKKQAKIIDKDSQYVITKYSTNSALNKLLIIYSLGLDTLFGKREKNRPFRKMLKVRDFAEYLRQENVIWNL